jgi:S1-C subfamily serine protease
MIPSTCLILNKSLKVSFILLLAGILLISGCVNKVALNVTEEVDLSNIKTVHVEKTIQDVRGIDILIANRLNTMGYKASTGDDIPPSVDALITYEDQWMWDVTMYMFQLTIFIRDKDSNFPLASANSMHGSLTRKSSDEMVAEVLSNLLGDSDQISDLDSEHAEISNQPNEPEKLRNEQQLLEISNKRIVEILSELEIKSTSNSINNYFIAYKQALDEGYKPETIPEVNSQIIILSDSTDDEEYELKINSDLTFPLNPIFMGLEETKKIISENVDENIIVVKTLQRDIERNVVDQDKVSSKYIYDYNIEPNPAYAAAQNEYQFAVNNYNSIMAQSSYRNYGGGLAGAIAGGLQGAIHGSAINAVNKAKQKLASTSPTIKVPLEKEYEYDKMTVKVVKTASYKVYALSRENNLSWVKNITESKDFVLVYNKNDNDCGFANFQYDEEEDVEDYEQSSINLSLKDFISLFASNPQKLSYDKTFSFLDSEKSKARDKKRETISVNNSRNDLMESVVTIQDNGKNTIGTGFFVDNDIILTNRHVVGDRKLIIIHTFLGEELLGKVINVHQDLDVALIKVDGQGIPVTFYTGDITIGSDVIAVGNPVGLEYSITKGIVSGIRKKKDEKRPLAEEYLYIQTDVAINPGNSGGPLFFDGKVIGINTLKLVRDDLEGIGFAIHIIEIVDYLKRMKIPFASISDNQNFNKISQGKIQRKDISFSNTINRGDKEIFDPEEKLKKVKDFFDKGLITKEEYDLERKEILDAM